MTTLSLPRRPVASLVQSLQAAFVRTYFNFYPAFRSTGAWLTYIARDWKEVRLKLPLTWRTRNYLGSLFGGSMYAAIDPIYVYMLYRVLGPQYIVWDKKAMIHFLKPGRKTLYANFKLDEAEITRLRLALESQPSVERCYEVQLVDQAGVVHACIEKTIYLSKRRAPAEF